MPSFGQSLEREKEGVLKKIHETMSEVRRRYLTDLPGQDMIYDEKRREAEALILSAETPTSERYPLLASDVGLDAQDLPDAAAKVLSQGQGWTVIAASLERVRRKHQLALEAATTVSDVRKVQKDYEVEMSQLLVSLS